MSDYIDTREGWREVTDPNEVDGITSIEFYDAEQDQSRYWVREAPVLPLPTAPYTVIRVTSTSGMESILIRNDLGWYEIDDMSAPVEQPQTGWSFEVLSEPRAVTAKAVIDRVSEMWTGDERIWDVAREFGVES